jgi:hypothetical protein
MDRVFRLPSFFEADCPHVKRMFASLARAPIQYIRRAFRKFYSFTESVVQKLKPSSYYRTTGGNARLIVVSEDGEFISRVKATFREDDLSGLGLDIRDCR